MTKEELESNIFYNRTREAIVKFNDMQAVRNDLRKMLDYINSIDTTATATATSGSLLNTFMFMGG